MSEKAQKQTNGQLLAIKWHLRDVGLLL